MRKPLLAAACVLIFGTAGCGSGSADNGTALADVGQDSSSPAPAGRAQLSKEQPFGQRHQFASGLSVTVAEPRTVIPSGGAYPRAGRALVFEVAVRNDSDRAMQVSTMSVEAAVDGTSIKQLVDPANGLRGMVDAGQDVAPGRGVRMTIAFAVPKEPVVVYLTVHPDASSGEAAHYIGKA